MPHSLQPRATHNNAYINAHQYRPEVPPQMMGVRNNKNCTMDKNNVSGKSSNGYFSDNDNSKFYNAPPPMDEEKSKENALKRAEPKEANDEPEWYSTPATLNDFIDLHGFEEGMDDPIEKKSPNPNGYGTTSLAYRRSGYSQNRFAPRVNNFNAGPPPSPHQQQQQPHYGNNPNFYNQQAQQNFNANVNQRFRNPLHYQKPMQSPNWPTPTINPFFDLWKRTRANPNENCSFQALMNHHRVQVPPNVPSITDIENALKSSNYLTSMMNKGPQQQNPHATSPQSVPAFFNNWPQQQQQQQVGMPTQAQLQKHTTEIMRNAMLRKTQQQQQQQHYQDEKPQFH